MFEGWASDLLAAYLGQFLEVQREQLRINLWSAWRTGVTLHNVALRPSAFDYLQLPFNLLHGRIGTLQIHVPWRALRSPVVIDLADVELTFELLTPESLSPEAAAHRAWAAKQAHIAAQELQELAAPDGVSPSPDGNGGKPAAEAKQGGLMLALLKHAITMLLRRLQLSVRNVHVKVQDPVTGRCFGLRLAQLHTCLPGETEHSSVLLADDGGVLAHSSAAARGSIQKQVAVDGIEFYWRIGESEAQVAGLEESTEESTEESLPLEEESRHFWSEDELEEERTTKDWRVLHPTGIVVHMSSKIIGSGGSDPIRVHAASVVHSLPVALRPCQLADMVRCGDQLRWTAARAKHAHLRPAELMLREGTEGGAAERDWRSMWRYAVNAVLADIRGPLKAAEWQTPQHVQQTRRQYVLLYRKKLEAEREQETVSLAVAPITTMVPGAEQCPPGAPTSNIRPPLIDTSQSPFAPPYESSLQSPSRPSGLSPIGEQRLAELERQLCVADILACRSAARQSLEGVGSTSTFTPTQSAPLTTAASGQMGDASVRVGGGGATRKGLFWGVGRIVSIVGYLPTLGGGSTKTSLPRPTESDVRELCEVVDFHPEYDEVTSSGVSPGERPGSAASSAGGAAAPVLDLSLNCLLTRTSATLKHDNGDVLAVVELHGLQSEVRIGSEGLAAGVTLTTLTGHAYTSSSSSSSSNTSQQNSRARELFERTELGLLGRGPHEIDPLSPGSPRSAPPPVLRLQFLANSSRLDLLVQPLRVHVTPMLLQSLAAFVPPPVQGSFGGACMDAVNGLNPSSTAAIKAEKLARLGPPLDLVAKFMNLELLLTKKGAASSGILLRTGAVLLHSVGQVAAFEASESVFKVLGSLRDVAGQRPAGDILAAAVTEIEQRLIYQHFELSVSGLELGTANSEAVSAFLPGYDDLKPLNELQLTSVLHPTALTGALKIHRFIEDQGAPQVQCAIKIDPIVAALTLPTVQLIATTLDLAAMAAPITPRDARTQPQPLGPIQAIVDLSLASLDVSFDAEGVFKGRLSLGETNLGLKAHTCGAGLSLDLCDLDLIDLSPEDPPATCIELGFIPRFAKRLSIRKCGVVVAPAVMPGDTALVEAQIEDLKLEGFASEPACFITRTHEWEPSRINFSMRLSPSSQRISAAVTNVSVGHATVLRAVGLASLLVPANSSSSSSNTPAGSNLNLAPAISGANAAMGAGAPSPQLSVHVAVEVRDCRLVVKYQDPPPWAGISVPGHLQDFFSLHEEMFSLELPHVSLSLPLVLPVDEQVMGAEGPSTVVAIVGASLIMATTGYLGRPALPVLQLPKLTVERLPRDAGENNAESSVVQAQQLRLVASSLDIGVHPSHLIVATLAVQLCQQQLIAYLGGGNSDTSSDVGSSIRVATMSPTSTRSVADEEIAGLSELASKLTPLLQPALAPLTTATATPITPIAVSEAATATPAAAIEVAPVQATPWQLDASLGIFGLSILGSTPSSTCLKAEWHQLAASVSSGCCPPTMSSQASESEGPPSLTATLTWSQLSFHVLQPKDGVEAMDYTPFIGSGVVFGSPNGGVDAPPGSQLFPSTPPFQQIPGIASAAGARVLKRSLSAGTATGLNTAVSGGGAPDAPDASGVQINVHTLTPLPEPTLAPSEIRSMLPRYSANSAVSRYFSAADSEFEDAASDFLADGSIRSPQEGRSPRAPSLLPLDLSSGDYEVEALVRLTSSISHTDPAPASNLGFSQHPQHGALAITALTLRVYLHGWHHVVECAHNYERFGTQAFSRIKAVEASWPQLVTLLAPTSHTSAGGAAAIPGSPSGSNTNASQGYTAPTMRLKIRARDLELEAVAASGATTVSIVESSRGKGNEADARIVPAGQVVATFSAEVQVGADGTRFIVSAPAVLLSVGPVRLADALSMEPLQLCAAEDSLVGLKGLEMTASSETFEFESDGNSSVVPSHRMRRSLDALAVSLHQASVWAGQRNLCAATALGQHVAHMVAELQSLQYSLSATAPLQHHHPHFHSHTLSLVEALIGEPSGGDTPGAIQPPDRHTAFDIEVDCIAVALHSQRLDNTGGNTPSPLFELAVSKLSVKSTDRGDGGSTGAAKLHLALDVFNGTKLAWEPVVDPWAVCLEFTVPQLATVTRAPYSAIRHLKLEVVSTQGLEATVTAAVTDAAAGAALIAGHVQAVAREPDTLHQHMFPDSSATAAASLPATFQMHNLTGSSVEAWVEAPMPGGATPPRPPVGPPTLILPPSGRSVLPVMTSYSGVGRSRRAGMPSRDQGVVQEESNSAAVVVVQEQEARYQRRRTLLYFRLAGQGPLAGPVHLDRPEASVHSVHLGQPNDPQISLLTSPTSARVVADTAEHRHGSFTATLHSGVRITNTTSIDLDIGMQTPMGAALGEPHTLGVLRSGESTWLPVTRAEVGMLCVRPTPAYRPERQGPSRASPSTISGGAGGGGNQHWSSGVVYRSGSQPLSSQQRFTTGSTENLHAASVPSFEWSSGVALAQLLRQSAEGSGHGATRQVACAAAAGEGAPLLMAVGATLQGNSWEVALAPTFTIHNALPVPIEAVLTARWRPPRRLHLAPNESRSMLHLEAAHVETVALRPEGFESTPALPIAPAPPDSDLSGAWQLRGYASSVVGPISWDEEIIAGPIFEGPSTAIQVPARPELTATLQEMYPGRSTVEVSIQHTVAPATGAHLLRISCGMWIYNCAGVPVSLRNASHQETLLHEAAAQAAAEDDLVVLPIDDDVPDSWVPPLSLAPADDGAREESYLPHGIGVGSSPVRTEIRSTPRPASAQDAGLRGVTARNAEGGMAPARTGPPGALTARSMFSAAGSSYRSVGRTASAMDVPGLSEILEGSSSRGGHPSGPTPGSSVAAGPGASTVAASPLSPSRGSVLGMQRTPSTRARGIADSMDRSPTFENPTIWPSMASGLTTVSGSRLRLQLRAAPTKAPVGRTFWSQPIDLDPSGGAVVTSIPSPGPGATVAAAAGTSGLTGSYPVVVTAAQVPGAGGVLAVCITPQFILRNLLDVPIQYKQQDTAGEREVLPGGVRAVRWTDDSVPPRLCVRVQEAGWLWSGGFQLDAPGDIFVKIRHRDRGVTMLVRVDVATSHSGSCHITLSHNPAGFAPYRVENCSLETLHARQKSVREQQDVLRPYCSLNYAWDEPTQPHHLVLELPGARHLGTFDLDKVGQDQVLTVSNHRREPEKHLRVIVRAEGPTRVLTVIDQAHHVLRSLPATTAGTAAADTTTTLPREVALTGPIWEVVVDLASIGVSLVGPTSEVAYLRLTGTRVTAAAGAARHSLSLTVRGIQLDNPSPWVAFPVTLVLPSPVSKLTSSVAAAVDLPPRPALELLVSLWQRRPAGVLCVEVAQLQMHSLAVYLDQQHLEEVTGVVTGLLPSPPSRPGDGSASGGRQGGALFGQGTVLGGGGSRSGSAGGTRSSSTSDLDSLLMAGGLQVFSSGGGRIITPMLATRGASSAQSTRVESGGEYFPTSGFATPMPSAPGTQAPTTHHDQAAMQTQPLMLAPTGPLNTASAPPGDVSWRRQKVYMDTMSISPVEVTLSFLSSPVHHLVVAHPRLAALQRLLSLADVEDARVWLAGLNLSNPLMDAEALGQALQRHYLRSLIPELYKLVGAASVIGDPVSLLQHLGAGVWTFVSAPAQGLVQSARALGPRQFLLGVLRGTRGLLMSVVFATSNAATKAAGAARKAIVVWGLDRQDEPLGAGSFRRRVMFIEEGLRRGLDADGDGALLSAILQGLAGLISEPIRGVEESGLGGLVRGMQRGAFRAVALPLAALLEMIARFADSVRRAVAGSSNLGWLRPPRHVSPSEALAPYDWSSAMGRWLLTELDRAEKQAAARARITGGSSSGATSIGADGAPALPAEVFLLCCPTKISGSYLVLTSRRILYVKAKGLMWEPDLLWEAAAMDLELVTHVPGECAVQFVAHPPLHRKIVPLLLRGRAARRPREPWFSFLSVQFEDNAAAEHVRDAADRLLEGAMPRAGVVKFLC